MATAKLLGGLVIVFLVVTFAVKNTEPTRIKYYFGLEAAPLPLYLLVLLAVLLGFGIGWATERVPRVRKSREVRRLSRVIEEQTRELEVLRQKQLIPQVGETDRPAAPGSDGSGPPSYPATPRPF